MVDRIVACGKITRREHLVLTSAILSDDKISEEDRHQINRVFDYIQICRLKFIDWTFQLTVDSWQLTVDSWQLTVAVVKADPPLACPLLPLKKGGTREFSKSPLLSGDLGGSPGNKQA